MSYSLKTSCDGCEKKPTCTDRHVLSRAITEIHSMPYGVGHLGAGTIEIQCHNRQGEQRNGTVELP